MISVITGLCNRWPLAKRMIESVPDGCELVIVDYASDDIPEGTDKTFGGKVNWQHRERPFQLCGGLNDGFAVSTGETVFFTHADCLHPADMLKQIAANVAPGRCYFPTFEWELEDGRTWCSDMAFGVCGFKRADVLEHQLLWNEKMDKAWGFQDNDIYDRAKAVLDVSRPFMPGLKHLYHPTATEYLERYYAK